MTRPILIACLCAAAVAGCGRTVVREEVVEKQPIVTRETVVERPAPIVAAAPSCALGAALYSSGTLSCQAGYQYVCRDGVWNRIPGSSC